jgi:hypothetical protein
VSPVGQRKEDQDWVNSVENRLVSLTSAQKQTDDELDDLDARLEELNHLLEGKPDDKTDNGLKGDLNDLTRSLRKLEAIMAPDSLLQGGVINRLKALESAMGMKQIRSTNRWQFGTAVATVTVTAIAGIITAMLAIEPVRKNMAHWIESRFSTQTSSKKAASKRSGTKRVTPRVKKPFVPARPPVITPEANDGTTDKEVSE